MESVYLLNWNLCVINSLHFRCYQICWLNLMAWENITWSLVTSCDWILRVIGYFVWLDTSCDWILRVIGYFVWLDTSCDWILRVIENFVWLNTSCDWILRVIEYFVWLNTSCDWILRVIGYLLNCRPFIKIYHIVACK